MLTIDSTNEITLRSMIGRVQNLKHFQTRLWKVTTETLDEFFASALKLQTLTIWQSGIHVNNSRLIFGIYHL